MVNQAVILAGGLGTRLGELTKQTPKPLLDIAGRPFLTYVLWNLKRHGIRDIVLSIGYRSEIVQAMLKDGSEYGVKIRYSIENTPLGTGGGVRNCLEFLSPTFLVLNGDTLFDIDYQKLSALFESFDSAPDGVVALRTVDDVARYGSVTLVDNRIVRFNEKGPSGAGLINGGIYLLRRENFASMAEGTKMSLETDLFPTLAHSGTLFGIPFDGYFLDIGLPETLNQAQFELPQWQQRWATVPNQE